MESRVELMMRGGSERGGGLGGGAEREREKYGGVVNAGENLLRLPHSCHKIRVDSFLASK